MTILEEKIKKAESFIGNEVCTIWGPGYVKGLSEDKKYVFLKGDEDICVELNDFLQCLY